ncbi:hypothetical protein ACFOGG_02730 [Brenneria rubrifaciens]|uniref:hypothetical protein n=1 Tax=Brenneria rubrifaciens TaxID=55213 RepID=UPI0036182E03
MTAANGTPHSAAYPPFAAHSSPPCASIQETLPSAGQQWSGGKTVDLPPRRKPVILISILLIWPIYSASFFTMRLCHSLIAQDLICVNPQCISLFLQLIEPFPGSVRASGMIIIFVAGVSLEDNGYSAHHPN